MAEFANPAYPAKLRPTDADGGLRRDRLVSSVAIEDFGPAPGGSAPPSSCRLHARGADGTGPFREQFWAAFDAYVPGTPLF